MRQAATLLKFARSTANPELSAVLIEKAAELKSRIDDTDAVDNSLRAPDVEASGRLMWNPKKAAGSAVRPADDHNKST